MPIRRTTAKITQDEYNVYWSSKWLVERFEQRIMSSGAVSCPARRIDAASAAGEGCGVAMSMWTAEERVAYEARAQKQERIREALGMTLRQNLFANIKGQGGSFLRGLEHRASDMELWWFYDFLMSAESDCIYDGYGALSMTRA